MKIELNLRWNLGRDTAEPLDESLFELLAGIQETGSLQKACRRAGCFISSCLGSARGVRDGTGQAARRVEPRPRVAAGPARQRIACGARARRITSRAGTRADCARTAEELASPAPATARRWRVFASHDLALLNAREALSQACGVELELETHGSDECLEALARRRCNVAGFHISGRRIARSSSARFPGARRGPAHTPGRICEARTRIDVACGP
jgi:hypothetical protein